MGNVLTGVIEIYRWKTRHSPSTPRLRPEGKPDRVFWQSLTSPLVHTHFAVACGIRDTGLLKTILTVFAAQTFAAGNALVVDVRTTVGVTIIDAQLHTR